MTKEKKENNNLKNILIIILIILVWAWAYFLWNNNNTSNKEVNKNIQTNNNTQAWIDNTKKIESVLVYDDSRCTDCNTNAIINKLKEIPELTNSKFIIKDYKKDSEVKTFLDKNKIPSLPLFIFNTNNIDPKLNQYLNKIPNSNQYFLLWWNFDPIAYDKLEKRKETPKTLDVFTMWFCPFWEIALKALPQIKDTFKNDNIKLNIHYIASKTWSWNTAKSFQSLHWTAEAWEDIRQLCIKKNYWIDKLINYLVERYKNADNYGRITDKPENAMKATWIDVNKIQKCINSWEWAKLLEEDIKLAQELWINASPTWLANNKYKFGGIKAWNIQTQFCSHNPDLKWCKTEIKEATTNVWWTPACWK